MRLTGFIVLVLLLLANVGKAQELNAADLRKREAMHELLALNAVQQRVLDTLFTRYASEMAVIDEKVKAAERDAGLSEDDVLLRLNAATQEKSDLRAVRELDIKALLTPSQRTVYEEKIAPSKPAVLHFGIHNRMDCNVCEK
jgi:hypothetical protein